MPTMPVSSRFQRIPDCRFRLDGFIGSYVHNVTEHWVKVIPASNPGMLEYLRDRDRRPLRGHWGHEGEYPGKFLTGAVEMFRLTRDSQLEQVLREFFRMVIRYQSDDGYLGIWPTGSRLTGTAPNVVAFKASLGHHTRGSTWDGWSHYHLMLALLLWHEQTGDRAVLRCVRRAADLLCRTFLDSGRRPIECGHPVNLAPIHALAMLYRLTGVPRYRRLAIEITRDFSDTAAAAGAPKGRTAGNYIEDALAGKAMHETANTRWEMLHVLMGIGELYYCTGDDLYRRVFEHYWWSNVEYERHNNGGFTTGESASGSPYKNGTIETCCTIAWIAMSVQMLAMSGDSVVADELELSTLNQMAGLFARNGRWVTYNTPMDGFRELFKMNYNWQARQGTPELNCCSANAPRGFGALSDWALMRDDEGLVLNYYGPGSMTADLRRGLSVTLEQDTEYPRRGRITLAVSPSKPAAFTLKLRIPCWSAKTFVSINGRRVKGVRPGCYLSLDRHWKRGDQVEIGLDMSPHYWKGEQECAGKVSIYRGPILLTYDPRYNRNGSDRSPRIDPATVRAHAFPDIKDMPAKNHSTIRKLYAEGEKINPDYMVVTDRIPALGASGAKGRLVKCTDWQPPFVLVEWTARNGRKVRLCDFASAGETGGPYQSWLKVTGVKKTPFSRANPLRSGRG